MRIWFLRGFVCIMVIVLDEGDNELVDMRRYKVTARKEGGGGIGIYHVWVYSVASGCDWDRSGCDMDVHSILKIHVN